MQDKTTLSNLEDIIVRRGGKKENADSLAAPIKENANTTEALKKSLELLYKEVQDMKIEMTTVW